MVGTMYPPDGISDMQIWVVRTDCNGDTLWTKTIGGVMGEIAYCIEPTTDSGYIVAGQTYSYGAGSLDVYLVKLGPDPELVTDIADNKAHLLPDFHLQQNHPNPFNPATTIEFDLPRRSNVKVIIYNLLGQEVSRLVDREFPVGNHWITWDGSTNGGVLASTGVYFYRLEAEGVIETKKMLLLK